MSIAQENNTQESKTWGVMTGDFIDGIGYFGPEKAVDNRARKIIITGSSFNPLFFSKKDVKSAEVVCAASDWIKYRICFKDGKVAVATFTGLSKDPMGVFTFEWWMADVIYKAVGTPVKKVTPKKEKVEEPAPAVPPTPVVEKKPVKKAEPKKEEPKKEEVKKEEPKKAAPKKKAEPKKEEPKKKEVKKKEAKKAAPKKKAEPKKEEPKSTEAEQEAFKMIDSIEDPYRLYQFSKQMYGAKSYQVAYYALKKMQAKIDKDKSLAKTYPDVSKMLNEIKDEVEYNFKGFNKVDL